MKRRELDDVISGKVCNGTDDLRLVCNDIIDGLDDDEVRCALRMALPLYAGALLRQRRSLALSPHGYAAELLEVELAEVELSEPKVVPKQGPSRRKQAERAGYDWRCALDAQVNLGPNRWKLLRDCNRSEIDAQVQKLHNQIAANKCRADLYEALAKAMADAGVELVGDLDDDTLRTIFGGQS